MKKEIPEQNYIPLSLPYECFRQYQHDKKISQTLVVDRFDPPL